MFKSITSLKVLKAIELLLQSDKTLTEISKSLEIKKPTALKHLNQMEDEGLVTAQFDVTEIGREKRYSLNPFSFVISADPKEKVLLYFVSDEHLHLSYPLIGQIRQKDFRHSIIIYLKMVVSKVKLKNLIIIIFGSVARGEGVEKSDIDILFLSDKWVRSAEDKIMSALSEAVIEAEIQAKPIFWTYEEFNTKVDYFAKQIRKDGLILYHKGEIKSIWQQMKRYQSITH